MNQFAALSRAEQRTGPRDFLAGANDARAEADHETLSAVHHLTVEGHAINEAQTAILKQLQVASA